MFVLDCRKVHSLYSLFFFLTAPAPPAIYTLSLHDALPISLPSGRPAETIPFSVPCVTWGRVCDIGSARSQTRDRKSTRLNSSHRCISYAVFCLKKKNINDKVKK